MKRSTSTTAVICLFALCGCSTTPEQQTASAGQPFGTRTEYANHTDSVTVSPAWKAQIDNALTPPSAYASGGDTVNAVLSDGIISSNEMNALEREAVGCYAQHGMQANRDYWFSAHEGIATFLNGKYNQDYETECEIASGYELTTSYYYDIRRNPDQIDLGPYIFQCYQEHGLADKPMTYDEYNRLKSEGREPLIGDPARSTSSQHAIWNTCWDDPLHNISSPPPQR